MKSIFVWPFAFDRRKTRESSQKRKNTAIWALVLTTERRYIKYSFVHYLDYGCK